MEVSVDTGALLAGASEALQRAAYDHAERLLQAALLIDPQLATAWALSGALALARGNSDDARTAYERAVALDDTDPLAAVTLAELYGQAAEADPIAKNRALALANWLLREDEVPGEIVDRASALKRSLRGGARP